MAKDKPLLMVATILSLFGLYYLFTLFKDGVKLQRWRKRWYKMPYHDEDEKGDIKWTSSRL